MPRLAQLSFARGEIAPALQGRADTAMYQVALAVARNVIIHASGGASNRTGLKYLAPSQNHANAARLFEFEFKATDTYILEFGDLYMRVFRDDGHVLEPSVVISAATQADPVVVTTATHGYANGDDVWIADVVGMTELNGRTFRVANKTATTFQLTSVFDGTDIDGTGYTAYSSAGTAARVYTLVTPYALADVPTLVLSQSADTVTITHKTYAPRDLTRTGHATWALTVKSFQPTTARPTGMSVGVVTSGSTTVRYLVTAIDGVSEEESYAALVTAKTVSGISAANPAVVTTSTAHNYSTGDEVYFANLNMGELNNRAFVVTNVSSTTFSLNGVDATSMTVFSGSAGVAQTAARITTSASTFDNSISWTASPGASRYIVYRETNGLFAKIGDTADVTFADSNIPSDDTITPPLYREMFFDSGDFPRTSSYFEQRQVYGGTDNEPDASYYSRVGQFDNMSVTYPGQDDDAISVRMNSRKVNEIRHFVPMTDLLVFTSGGEWKVSSGADGALTPSSIRQKPQTSWGISDMPPIEAGDGVIFVDRSERRVRSFGYSFQSDKYTGSDLSLLAHHIFEDQKTGEEITAVDWAFSPAPDPTVFVVLSNGTAAALTYNQEQEVIAWSRIETDGDFESVAMGAPVSGSPKKHPHFLVKRTVNGSTVRYIERFTDRRVAEVEDSFFLDSGLSYSAPKTISAVTLASPGVLTCTAHNFTDGDEVHVSGIRWVDDVDTYGGVSQPAQFNGGKFLVANGTTNTFTLQKLDGTNIDTSAYKAYASGGKAYPTATTVSGLHHLEGEAVQALADGAYVKDLTVTAGAITVPRAAGRIHVGQEFSAEIQTLDLELEGTSLRSRNKSLKWVQVQYEKTRGLLIGSDFDTMEEMKQRDDEPWGSPIAWGTGKYKATTMAKWKPVGQMSIRQKYPLPMTVLSITTNMDVEE
tara:strand:- start:1598 stop:4393 length:2796 start_codon:yes stop_codon:yes gene_type:complete